VGLTVKKALTNNAPAGQWDLGKLRSNTIEAVRADRRMHRLAGLTQLVPMNVCIWGLLAVECFCLWNFVSLASAMSFHGPLDVDMLVRLAGTITGAAAPLRIVFARLLPRFGEALRQFLADERRFTRIIGAVDMSSTVTELRTELDSYGQWTP